MTKHPKIGSRYAPAWFEQRSSERTYAALRPPMSPADLRVQAALLQPPARPSRVGAWLTAFVLALALLAAFWPA